MAPRPRAKSLKSAGKGPVEDKRLLPRRTLGLALILGATLCLSTCGLDVVSYYQTPGFTYIGNGFTLTHNTANSDSNFLGYDIYYHAYQTQTLADTARTTIETAISSTSSTPQSVLSSMTSSGFVKIYKASAPTVSPTPLCKVTSPATAVNFNFLMDSTSIATNWYYTASTDSASTRVYVVRALPTATSNSFNYTYGTNDPDSTGMTAGVTAGGIVYLVFFAVAYGYDIGTLSSIYSFPTSLLQSIAYALPPNQNQS